MSLLNLGKFSECLGRYKHYCDRTLWTKKELPKFYFANILSRRVQLNVQTPEMIYQICRRVEEKDYYYKPTDTRICGIRFLPGANSSKFAEPITPVDAKLLKDLVYLNWSERDFAKKRLSFNALSGWLGTLLPQKFMPVTSNHFRHTIAYLFDLDLKIYEETEFDYFLHSQKYFWLTKKRLKEFSLESLYLKEIAEYVKFNYPKSVAKKHFEEHDWNWLTHDFHLFIFREVLCLDLNFKSPPRRDQAKVLNPNSLNAFERAEVLNIYVP